MKTYEKEAKRLCDAMKKLASNESSLDNLECYLSFHFKEWLERFASTPADMACEMEEFSKIN
jgi:TorA maturation chaperone TorD